ncbi:MAG: YraN family protein [Deltaproteobacteria bacterium]|nr:YraN family protein [Deltaproteobacteria bacterium]MBW2595949.1 YraN family protein [Deltaproteobacteria bacterium]MBW2650379.1 YraN family protein [Deltaproteobacteria bacterium]
MAGARSTEGLSRSNNIEKGRKGEDMAAACLRKEGYRIVERNYRCLYGEVDIIAMDAGDIVFIEVKSRKSDNFGSPEEAVGITKQKKISRVALNYLREKGLADHNARFDIVAIRFMPQGNRIKLIRNAFDLSY